MSVFLCWALLARQSQSHAPPVWSAFHDGMAPSTGEDTGDSVSVRSALLCM